MTASPYSSLAKNELVLRDHLAADRTVLANERTFLAYMRTALTLFVAGATFVKFFNSTVLLVIGYVFIPCGVVAFAVGLSRYLRMRKELNSLR